MFEFVLPPGVDGLEDIASWLKIDWKVAVKMGSEEETRRRGEMEVDDK